MMNTKITFTNTGYDDMLPFGRTSHSRAIMAHKKKIVNQIDYMNVL